MELISNQILRSIFLPITSSRDLIQADNRIDAYVAERGISVLANIIPLSPKHPPWIISPVSLDISRPFSVELLQSVQRYLNSLQLF